MNTGTQNAAATGKQAVQLDIYICPNWKLCKLLTSIQCNQNVNQHLSLACSTNKHVNGNHFLPCSTKAITFILFYQQMCASNNFKHATKLSKIESQRAYTGMLNISTAMISIVCKIKSAPRSSLSPIRQCLHPVSMSPSP